MDRVLVARHLREGEDIGLGHGLGKARLQTQFQVLEVVDLSHHDVHGGSSLTVFSTCRTAKLFCVRLRCNKHSADSVNNARA